MGASSVAHVKVARAGKVGQNIIVVIVTDEVIDVLLRREVALVDHPGQACVMVGLKHALFGLGSRIQLVVDGGRPAFEISLLLRVVVASHILSLPSKELEEDSADDNADQNATSDSTQRRPDELL